METFDQNLPVVEISSEEASTFNGGDFYIAFYDDINFGRGSINDVLHLSKSKADLGKFDNKISSIYVGEGTWDLYLEPNYQKKIKRLGPGQYRWVEDIGIPNDKISSVKLVGNY